MPPTAEEICRKKKQYRTRRLALSAVSKARIDYGVRYRPYRCRVCRLYHMTKWVHDGTLPPWERPEKPE